MTAVLPRQSADGPDDATRTSWYRKPWVAALAVALVLLIVVVSVFSVSSLARQVSTLSQRSHAHSEVLRVSGSVQTQMSVVDGFRQLGDDVDTTVLQANTQTAAAAGLTSLNQALDNPFLADEARTELSAYLNLVERHLSEPDGEVSLGATEAAFDTLVETLGDSRAGIEDELVEANSRMNLVASIAGFVIAFVVPAAGLAAWELLRRFRDRQVMLDDQVARMRVSHQAVVDELTTELSAVTAQTTRLVGTITASSTRPEHDEAVEQSQELAKRVRSLDASTRVKARIQTSVWGAAAIADTISQALSEDNFPFLILPSAEHLPPETSVHADHDLLALALAELFRYGAANGVRINLEASVGPQQVELVVQHPGEVDSDVTAMVFHGDTPRLRDIAPVDGPARELLNIRYMLDAAGATLSLVPGDGEVRHIVGLARSADSPAHPPSAAIVAQASP